jgi:hypothetical protein
MMLLRRVLALGALLLIGIGVPLALVPSTVTERLLGQQPLGDDVWLRLFGVAGVVIGLFHVLIIRKLDDVWWWCWAFVLFDGVSAVIVVLHAVIGVPEGAAVWPWWLYGFISAAFSGLYLAGIARAGTEKPFV